MSNVYQEANTEKLQLLTDKSVTTCTQQKFALYVVGISIFFNAQREKKQTRSV